MRIRSLAACIALSLNSASLYADSGGGLRCNYSKIVIDNLPIGHAISMSTLANLPLVIGNNADAPVAVSVVPRAPEFLRDGYDPIPDPAWIAPAFTNVTIPAGAESRMDVVLNIPNSHYLLGRKFQADLVIRTGGNPDHGAVAFSYEIIGTVLFSIAPVLNDDALAAALRDPLDAAYSLAPPRVDIFGARPGAHMPVVNEAGRQILLTNDSEKPERYSLRSIDPATSQFTPDRGSHFPGTTDDISIKSTSVELAPHESKPLDLAVHIPVAADLSAGPLVYLVSVRNGDIQGVEQYVKIYLWPGTRPQIPAL